VLFRRDDRRADGGMPGDASICKGAARAPSCVPNPRPDVGRVPAKR